LRVVLVLALSERLEPDSPVIALAAAGFGWAGLVLGRGMIGNAGLHAVTASPLLLDWSGRRILK
jgi:hypothetical protein